MKADKGVKFDTELTAEDMKELVKKFKKIYSDNMDGEEFPRILGYSLLKQLRLYLSHGIIQELLYTEE